jgi:FMN-dependent NADH-azoreductase
MNPTTLLHIDASPRGSRSKSRELGHTFVAQWRAAHPTSQVVRRDIGQEPPPFVTEAWVEGAFAPPEAQSPAARAAIETSNRYVDELLAADDVLITTPIYNLSLPATLKAWIDQVVRVGRTFATKDGRFEGLVHRKRVVIIVTSGSDFRPDTPGGAYNFLEPYLRAVLGFIGITQVEFVYAHSLASPASAPQAITDASTRITTLARAA